MRVAFMAMSNHLNVTHSTDFLIEQLREFFGEVSVIAHERAWIDLPRQHWDLIVVFQKQYSPRELEAFGADRVVLVPMYDACPQDEGYWRRYSSFKVLCFSSTMERNLSSYGLAVLGARYYPELPEICDQGEGLKAFYWPRSGRIDWAMVRKLSAGARFDRFHLHAPQSSPDAAADPSLELSSWFADPAEYGRVLRQSNVFFAPRDAEGIGHSFIEALALGHCVVAPDGPTMNEYITDRENGLLYDPRQPSPLDFSRARELGAAARASCEAGRKAWLASLPELKRFLEEPLPGYRPARHPMISLRGRLLARLRLVPGLHSLYRALRHR